jgi:hypothetical protein
VRRQYAKNRWDWEQTEHEFSFNFQNNTMRSFAWQGKPLVFRAFWSAALLRSFPGARRDRRYSRSLGVENHLAPRKAPRQRRTPKPGGTRRYALMREC